MSVRELMQVLRSLDPEAEVTIAAPSVYEGCRYDYLDIDPFVKHIKDDEENFIIIFQEGGAEQ